MDNEEKYTDIRDRLKALEPVRASENFEHKLHSKIIELESEKRKVHERRFEEGRGGFLKNLFSNNQYPWIMPAAGFAVLLFFIFYVTFVNKNVSENELKTTTEKRQEITGDKIIPEKEESNTTTVPEANQSGTLSEKDKLSEKDLAGDLNTKKPQTPTLPVEIPSQQTDRDNFRTYKKEVNNADTDQLKKGSVITNEQDEEKEAVENNGLVSEEQKAGISPDASYQTSVTSEAPSRETKEKNSKSKKSDTESERKKLSEKLMKINKTSLEKLREEIIK